MAHVDPDDYVECPYDKSHRPLRKRLQYHLMECRKVECRYDKSHRPLRKRLQYHLVECRKNNPHLHFKICPFNATHHLPRSEMRKHIVTCPDKDVIHRDLEFAQRKDDPTYLFKGCTDLPVYKRVEIPTTEDWDSEVGTFYNQPQPFAMFSAANLTPEQPTLQPTLQPRDQPHSSVYAYSVGAGRGRGRGRNGARAAKPGRDGPSTNDLSRHFR